MKKCCFIIPYFGKFPNYFQLFLNSCKYNTDFNWLIFTDNSDYYEFPQNVKIVKTSFDSFKEYIQSFFDFKIVIPTPHKLCDYKPAYGYLFSSYLSEFKYWGYCDIDLLMGDLNQFLTDKLLETYDKIFCLGHMTLFRNLPEINEIFKHEYNGRMLYKESFSTEKTTTFDEEWRDENNINQMFIAEKKKVFTEDYSMNPAIAQTNFIRTKYVGIDKAKNNRGYQIEEPKNALYTWDNGHIYRYYMTCNNTLKREEFIYMHFQWRKMKIDNRVFNLSQIKIIPNKFLPLEYTEVTKDNFRKIKKRGLCFHRQRLLWKKLHRKLNKILHNA